jgi:anion-transporting  ArsA/GET3 family ATPase
MTRPPLSALSALERKLVVVTGKGGVGKSTIAGALALSAAARGLRTIVVELGDQSCLPALFARSRALPRSSRAEPGEEIELAENLFSVTIDQDRAMLEWLQEIGGRVPGRILAGSSSFQYFAAAAPGARELVSMVKVWELTSAKRWRKRARQYDLVVLDAPATGHALGLLHAPHTFGAIARVGPIFGQAEHVRKLLEDEAETAYLAVTLPTEMATAETIDLRQGLRSQLGVDLSCAIVNATLPARRFSASEIDRIERLTPDQAQTANESLGRTRAEATDRPRDANGEEAARRAAVLAAKGAYARARTQQKQISRLRRHGLPVLTVPFVFTPELGLGELLRIGRHLTGGRVP